MSPGESPPVDSPSPIPPRRFPGWGTLAAVTAFYTACLAAATYPVALTFRSRLPGGSGTDTLQHLWLMKWYRSCLLNGRLPFLCPDVHYPIGAPLGNYSPTTLQSLLYLPLSSLTGNDTLCLNIIWLFAFLTTGLGTFLLAWWVLRDRACAAFAGLPAMISTPMLIHAGGHLELICVGAFPLFLLAWARFNDAPTRGRLAGAAGAYLLLAMSSPYFVILGLFPAVLYVAWGALRGGRRAVIPWSRARLPWLLAFSGIVALGLPLIFSGQIWNLVHHLNMARPRSEFDRYGAPLWSYLLPTHVHKLGQWLMPAPVYAVALVPGECYSYLGVPLIGLLAYAAFHRLKAGRSAYWWALLGLMVLLSMGASFRFGTRPIPLPGGWLWKWFPPYRLMRVPGRFNLFVPVAAGVLAAAGLRHLLNRIPSRFGRAAVWSALAVAVVADNALVPYGTVAIPAMPRVYSFIKARNPHATLLEAPQLNTGGAHVLLSYCGYWQSIHGLSTSAAYSAHANHRFDHELTYTSPVFVGRLIDPNFLREPGREAFDLQGNVDFASYLWLYTHYHQFDYIVLHKNKALYEQYPVHAERLEALLRDAKVFEDDDAAAYEVARLAPPTKATLLCTEGWGERGPWRNRGAAVAERTCRMVVFNPDPARPLMLGLELEAFRKARNVRLRSGGVELARWPVPTRTAQLFVAPPFRLPAGVHELTLASDGEERPAHRAEEPTEGDRSPHSLRVSGLCLRPAEPAECRGAVIAVGPDRAVRR